MRAAVLFTVALAGAQSSSPLFSQGSRVVVGQGSGTVLLADVNADGHTDLLTNHLLSKRLGVQLGDGRGRFSTGTAIEFDFDPAGPLLADFNGDGALDLAVTQGMRDVVHIYKGSGTGTFEKIHTYTVTDAAEPLNKRTLRALDVNGDGHLDLVTANGRRRNTFAMLFGNGRGEFAKGPEVTVDSGRDGYVLAFADFDGDRHVDVVTASRGGEADTGPGRMIVRLGDGHGRFTPSAQPPFATAPAPRDVQAVDLNGDSHLDLATLSGPAGILTVFLNDGRGRFTPSPSTTLAIDSRSLTFEDVNGDRVVDLVTPTIDSVSIFLGPRFTPAPGSPFRAGPGSYAAAVGDLNGDGKRDIVASSFGGDAVAVLLRR